jgi:RHS repeat-associated protein
MLGGSNEQLAVYHGQQTSGTGICGDTGRRVYMYPDEYLAYGIGTAANVAIDPTGQKQYRIFDHLGSLRSMTSTTGGTSDLDYEPFGRPLPASGKSLREGFIDRERDRETGANYFGKRMMSSEDGEFRSVDVLWENYRAISPYSYGLSSPMNLKDGNGMWVSFEGMMMYEDQGREYEKVMVNELERITGLTLKINGVRLEVDLTAPINCGSKTARDLLLRMINDSRRLLITVSKIYATQNSPVSENAIMFNPKEMILAEHQAFGLSSLTMGWGMTLFHEYLHTEMGGDYKDPDKDCLGYIGQTDVIPNIIRRELGPEWGQG